MPERSWIADWLGECKVCPPNRPLEVLIDSSLGTPSKPAPFPHTQWGEGRGGERIATLLRGVDERLSRYIISHIGSFVKCAISSYKPGVHLSDAFGLAEQYIWSADWLVPVSLRKSYSLCRPDAEDLFRRYWGDSVTTDRLVAKDLAMQRY